MLPNIKLRDYLCNFAYLLSVNFLQSSTSKEIIK